MFDDSMMRVIPGKLKRRILTSIKQDVSGIMVVQVLEWDISNILAVAAESRIFPADVFSEEEEKRLCEHAARDINDAFQNEDEGVNTYQIIQSHYRTLKRRYEKSKKN